MNVRTMSLLFLAWLAWLPLSAQAEVVVIVGLESPVQRLTSEQVARVFLRKKSDLPDGLVLEPVDQPKGAVRDAFYLDFIGMNRARINAYWAQRVFTGAAQPPLQTSSGQDAATRIAESKLRIGYAEATEVTPKVRVVEVVR